MQNNYAQGKENSILFLSPLQQQFGMLQSVLHTIQGFMHLVHFLAQVDKTFKARCVLCGQLG